MGAEALQPLSADSSVKFGALSACAVHVVLSELKLHVCGHLMKAKLGFVNTLRKVVESHDLLHLK